MGTTQLSYGYFLIFGFTLFLINAVLLAVIVAAKWYLVRKLGGSDDLDKTLAEVPGPFHKACVCGADLCLTLHSFIRSFVRLFIHISRLL